MNAYLAKPVRLDQIATAVRTYAQES
jgi:hypothetical protein